MINSIRGRVTLWSIVIVGVLNLFLSMYIYIIINNKLEKNIQNNMETIKFMAKNYAMLQINTDGSQLELEQGAQNVVDGLYNIFGEYVAIALDKDEIVKSRGNLLNINKADLILQESENKKSLLMLTKEKASYIATYNYPIYVEERFCGNIIIQRNYYEEYNENFKILTTIFIGQFIMLIILIIAIWFIIKRFTKPLNKLSKAMENFGRGEEQEDVSIRSKDEVAVLANNFNFMKNEIKEQMDVIIKEQSKNREFFNNATHELKTPITAISGYAQVLLEEDIVNMDEEFRERALIRLVKESNKLNCLVKNLLEISSGERQRIRSKQAISFGELVNEKISELQIRLLKSQLEIKKSINDIIVNGYKEELNTIIINLIDNAIKYSADKVIDINVYEEDNYCIFEIKNQVYKIPQDISDKLLEPFVKYSDDSIMEREGISSSGLGLYICNQLSQNNNGILNYTLEENFIIFKLKVPKA